MTRPNPFQKLSAIQNPTTLSCTPIASIMTQTVHTLSLTDTLRDALHLFRSHPIRHLVVVDGYNIVRGVFSKRDLLVLQGESGGLLDRGVMTAIQVDPIVVQYSDCTKTSARILLLQKIGCLPVVSEKNVLVGIVTEADFVRAYAEQSKCHCGVDLDQPMDDSELEK